MVQSQAENGPSALCLRGWHILEEETWDCVLTRVGLLGQCWGVGGEGLRFPHVKQGAWGVTDMHGNSRAAGRIPGCGWHLPRALVPSAWVNRASRGSGTGLPPELTAPLCPHHQPTFCELHWSGNPAWCASPRGGTRMAASKEGHWMITCQ